MLEQFAIAAEDLRHTCDPAQFDFQDTSEVPPLATVIGQERAVQAIDFGLNMKSAGYNIFVTGLEGTGKSTIVGDIVGRYAQQQTRPDDWCLVNNFQDEYRPIAIAVPAGRALALSKRMAKLVSDLRTALPKIFADKEFLDRQARLQEKYARAQEALFHSLETEAAQKNLRINRTKMGFQTLALKNNQPITKEEFAALPETEQTRIKETIRNFQSVLEDTELKTSEVVQQHQSDLEQLMQEAALFVIRSRLNVVRSAFEGCPAVMKYLDQIQEDMLENINYFLPAKDDAGGRNANDHHFGGFSFKRYVVNVLADRQTLQGAPVIMEPNPTYRNVFGHIEKRAYMGGVKTDFSMVQGGALLRANGGYLIMEIESLMMNPLVWEALKRALQTKLLSIEDMASEMGYGVTSLRPEPIPLDVKVILLGNYTIFETLQNHDSKFDKIFKVRADFDSQTNLSAETVQLYARFIARTCREERLRPFTARGVAAMVEFSARFTADQKKLSLRFGPMVGILKEADYWARKKGAPVISEDHIRVAIHKRRFRYNLYEEKMREAFENDRVLLDVKGERIGQVNALAVYQMGDIAFGRPSRITAEIFMGKSGIVNIEREADLSGRTHDKGVMILSGYLGRTFAQQAPLGIAISLTFEQSYGPVDGDSASSTELYVILSSLADLPIRQGIAVTGSVNQKGEIQAIGGVNQKIEGYFEVCRQKGLTGSQGVIVPRANITNLMLNKEVVNAVREGQFHVYQVADITEGIEILTGLPAGSADDNGVFPPDTVYGRIQAKLKTYLERAQILNRAAHKKSDDR
ncbi:MAG: ATP-binding protein [Desulfobacterales bacterium]|jgi:lon-related putative ATP-dependent protease